MEHAELESEEWPRIIARLGGEEALTSSARTHGSVRSSARHQERERRSSVGFMYGPGGYSLRGLAALAAGHGIADVSDVAILDRVRGSADWLEALCKEQLGRAAEAIRRGAAGRPIRIVDGSRLEGPGDRAWRLHLCYDAGLSRVVDASITTTREGERLDRLAVTSGEIRLGDRGLPATGWDQEHAWPLAQICSYA